MTTAFIAVAFFAAQRDDAEADARQYADALLSGGVEDLTGGRGRS